MPPGWMNLDMSQPDDVWFGGEKGAFSGMQLTKTQRLMCFGGCFLGGMAISLLGAIMLLTFNANGFAALFALGAVVSLVGTGFLIGFNRQRKMMFAKVRIVATIVMILAIIMTFVAAFVLPSVLCILFVIIQYLCLAWYSLSYIPYARTAVKNLFTRAV